ncbi:glycosyltransferase family protein [Olleya namhaensis]|uniref:Uncharacterized protein n=1 Tax=Olleya namhaensis TaxID=1144750 RepID=A0A1I3NJH6_9FLAO|nr:hypothetical protein [Olleya namhaensis]SFJ09327.1 hypothetical protein SAMN05443431_104172 [Olleya namhaensis]
MNFLVIAQDLRVSGTSEGVVSRSFLAKLRMAYPDAVIDVLYLKNHNNDDQLELLPVNSIQSHKINLKPTFTVKWINRFTRRLFNISWYDKFIHKSYGKHMNALNHEKYDHVFIRSSGLKHETLLAAKDLPILKKAIINFHDPYPFFWYQGSLNELTGDELNRFHNMFKVVQQAKVCISTAKMMSEDLEFLYGSRKRFYTLPHQFSETVFDLTDIEHVRKKQKLVTLAYHGSIQFGRKIDVLLDAYDTLVRTNVQIKDNTEFVLRLGGGDVQRLREKYAGNNNIAVLGTLNFSNSSYEQKHIADINVILENGPFYCNILVGKAPFLASLNKPIFCVSPQRSELSNLIKNKKFIACGDDLDAVRLKLEALITDTIQTKENAKVFGDYFSDAYFKDTINNILNLS